MRNALFLLVTLMCNLYGGDLSNCLAEICGTVLDDHTCTLKSTSASTLTPFCCAQPPQQIHLQGIPGMTRVAAGCCIVGACSYMLIATNPLGLCYGACCYSGYVGCLAATECPQEQTYDLPSCYPCCCRPSAPEKAPVMDT